MSTLLNYINELDCNADLLAAHKNDPEATMKSYGLSDEEIAAVMSGDKAKLAKLTGSDLDLFEKAIQIQQK
ncbi:hypothetical protein SAMN04488540_109128 [Ferrimonas sediminum]|uniref:Extradiol ring-cleavage dioxygenase LigAB LigA subunit domain-containing protein n=1 Tax=Ferrimonas sediminum TaxID=718193 RepID=A0A1G8UL22_9GAMM|nr:hypothetical protein [Ferrimonas sediminum]SDJ54586.1 hypothetical protein SAMN04488540_109128 [Ferrimonas sediminum]